MYENGLLTPHIAISIKMVHHLNQEFWAVDDERVTE